MKKKIRIRLFVQLFFLALITLIAVNHTLIEKGKGLPFLAGASLHAVCPFGGVVSVYQFATLGTFVQKIHESSFVLMILVFLLTLLLGPAFCGWVCPLGTVQELVSKIGRKIFKKRHNHFIPAKLDKYLRFLRYFVLIWVIFMTARSGTLLFSNIDPYFALFNFWTSEVAVGGLIVLGVTLLASLFVERPWCKYACPYGALLGLFNFVRIFKIKRNPSTCISCKLCDKACPMNINVSEVGSVRDHQCISCLECTSEAVCPVADTVVMKTGGKA